MTPQDEEPENCVNQSTGNKLLIPPESNEVEVSVFGPGYGECILVHVHENEWLIVDSCVDPYTKKAVLIKYLRGLGIDPGVAVKIVVASHWHDDHVRGLAQIFEECASAELVCSDALSSAEFIQLTQVYDVGAMQESSGISEFRRIVEIMNQRRNQKKDAFRPPKFATADKCLWRHPLSSERECAVYSLSPSDDLILAAKREIANLLPRAKEPKRWLPVLTPNNSAVVLWIDIGDFSILLGSDLEKRGWSVIVSSKTRPHSLSGGKASFYKIPHHGSVNAHHPEVWSQMLNPHPICVLTPYDRSTKLPTKKDTQRICSLTDNAYSTAIFRMKRRKRSRTVDKSIKETVKSIKQIHSSVGHVRLRTKCVNDLRVELFGDALELKELYSGT